MNNKCIEYHVYLNPEKPTENGIYFGKTPIIEQAEAARDRLISAGKPAHIKQVNNDGSYIYL